MYGRLQLIYKYIQYWLRASNGKGHGIHSPFVFEFVTKVLNDKRAFYAYETIEKIRRQLQHNQQTITIEDFGAGSRLALTKERKISAVASSSLKPKKYSQLLFRMVNYYGSQNIVELGTSLGITTSYLASANTKATVFTMEGSSSIANIAVQNFATLNLQNIQLIKGNFDDTLPVLLKDLPLVNFAFVDGNHRKAPTLSYFQQLLQKKDEHSVFVFDDIHWSREMEEAWEEIKRCQDVTLSIDLFFIGIIFFRKENKARQHFTVRF